MAEGATTTFTQSPAGTAFSTLYGQVQNYCLTPAAAEAILLAKEGINDAIKRLNTRRWTWSRAKQDITLVVGEPGREYPLSTSFKSPRAAELLDTTSRVKGTLPWVDPKNWEEVFPDRSGATTPTAYTVFNYYDNGAVTVNAAPTAAYIAATPILRLRFWRRIPLLSADADLLAAPTEVEPFIKWMARAYMAAHLVGGEKLAYAERQWKEWWSSLVIDDVKQELGDW